MTRNNYAGCRTSAWTDDDDDTWNIFLTSYTSTYD